MNVTAPQLALRVHSCWQSVAVYGEDKSPDSTTCQPWHSPPETKVGSETTVMPRAAEAEAAVPRLEVSELCRALTLLEAGTERMAVMSTLPEWSKAVTSAALKAVSSSTRGSGWADSGPVSSWECRAAQRRHQARPEEAQAPS